MTAGVEPAPSVASETLDVQLSSWCSVGKILNFILHLILDAEQVVQGFFFLPSAITCCVCVLYVCFGVSNTLTHSLASLANQAYTPFQQMLLTLQDCGKEGAEAKEEFM